MNKSKKIGLVNILVCIIVLRCLGKSNIQQYGFDSLKKQLENNENNSLNDKETSFGNDKVKSIVSLLAINQNKRLRNESFNPETTSGILPVALPEQAVHENKGFLNQERFEKDMNSNGDDDFNIDDFDFDSIDWGDMDDFDFGDQLGDDFDYF
jgi:hypothetical protein